MTGSDMELRMADDPAVVSKIVERTIKTIYPHYYPSGAVQLFLDLHSKVRIEEVMSSEEIYLVMVQGAFRRTKFADYLFCLNIRERDMEAD